MESKPLAQALERQVPSGSDAAQVAAAVVEVWRLVFAALGPMLGPAGVAAMYRRSVAASAQVHTWLPRANGADTLPDLDALHAALASQDAATALVAGGDSLQAFHDLLALLVGPSLTARLLAPVPETLIRGLPAQDPNP